MSLCDEISEDIIDGSMHRIEDMLTTHETVYLIYLDREQGNPTYTLRRSRGQRIPSPYGRDAFDKMLPHYVAPVNDLLLLRMIQQYNAGTFPRHESADRQDHIHFRLMCIGAVQLLWS